MYNNNNNNNNNNNMLTTGTYEGRERLFVVLSVVFCNTVDRVNLPIAHVQIIPLRS